MVILNEQYEDADFHLGTPQRFLRPPRGNPPLTLKSTLQGDSRRIVPRSTPIFGPWNGAWPLDTQFAAFGTLGHRLDREHPC
jgi:hypothetical protein